MEKRTGMLIGKINQECAPKTFSTLSLSPSPSPNHNHNHSYSHKAFSDPSHRTTSNHFTLQTGTQKKIRLQKEWEEKIERLNKKYNLDYYSSLESDSDSVQEQDYRYEHKYETLIETTKFQKG